MASDGAHHPQTCIRIIMRKDDHLDQRVLGARQVVQRKQPLDKGKSHPRSERVIEVFLLVTPIGVLALSDEDGVALGEIEQCTGRDANHETTCYVVGHTPPRPDWLLSAIPSKSHL
jgi:hypothetical protein